MFKADPSNLLDSLKEQLVPLSEEVWERHRTGGSGLEVVQAYTKIVDALLCEIYSQLARRHGNKPILRTVAIVCLGGYGRGELNPHSDIDIMFLVHGEVHKTQEDFISEFIALLWDMKFNVGHSCRQLKDCLELVRRDVITANAMLEGRYLIGFRPVFDKFKEKVQRDYVQKYRKEFVRKKIDSILERHKAHDNSQFHLEPKIKEGVGGLRDVHSALWIERVAHGIQTLDDLKPTRLVDEFDIAAIKVAYEFLLRVRTELHLLAGRKQDVLNMDYQQQVAQGFGFSNTQRKSATESFMSYYYMNVGFIRQFLNIILERERQNPSFFSLTKRKTRPELLPLPFVFRKNTIYLVDDVDVFFAGEPGVRILMRLMQVAHDEGMTLSDHLCRCIRRSIPLVRLQLLHLEEVHHMFWNFLRSPGRISRILRIMHETDFLSAILPEFEGTTCLYQYDYYHQFTVDEHTLRVMEEAELFAETDAPEFRSIRQAAGKIKQLEILRLAILLHDAGKAEGRAEHTRNGVRLAMRATERLQADPEVTRSVRSIIENHLLMSRMAHRRDLSDPNVTKHFNEVMGSPDMVNMLYVLTCADIRGVGHGSWTGWKAALLEELYFKSSIGFVQGDAQSGDSTKQIRQELKDNLPDSLSYEEVDRHLEKMPERYLFECNPEEIITHMLLVRDLQEKLFAISMERATSGTEFVICTSDRLGLFAEITGTLAGAGCDIRSAQLFTRSDGVALDIFLLNDKQGRAINPNRIGELEKTFAAVFAGEKTVSELIRRQEKRLIPGRRMISLNPPRVVIDNESATSYTILEVFTHDRVGLLYRIALAISELKLDIHLAKIATDVDQVLDVFYVSDRQGNQIKDPQELDKIELTLLSVLEKSRPPSRSAG
ncbi:MAG: [protein-PII] uridylyltransferase [Planctomycetota bacterium]|nr:[protein-PII] uridylyltransferase [Planctomycetota bacterium]